MVYVVTRMSSGVYLEQLKIYDLLKPWKTHGGNICQLCGYQDEFWYVHWVVEDGETDAGYYYSAVLES